MTRKTEKVSACALALVAVVVISGCDSNNQTTSPSDAMTSAGLFAPPCAPPEAQPVTSGAPVVSAIPGILPTLRAHFTIVGVKFGP
jgi:hypothetical protein